MIGVKDHHQESLIGQAGEIEPVYDRYALGFSTTRRTTSFIFRSIPPALRSPRWKQSMDEGFLPSVKTLLRTTKGTTNIRAEMHSKELI